MRGYKYHRSPTITLLRYHYQQIGLLDWDGKDKGWSPDQIRELCKLMRITTGELASLICLRQSKMNCYMQHGAPPEVALHFMVLKQWYIERTMGTVSEPVMPVGILI